MADVTLDERAAALPGLIREAGALAHDHFVRRADLEVEQKGLQDWVSAADREVEELLRSRVTERFPSDGFWGEESGGVDAEAYWLVDPIDGTTNFLRGIPHYGVTVAYVRGGVTELGAVFAPEVGELYQARRGHGATLNGAALKVSDTPTFSRALIGLGYSSRTSQDDYVRTVQGLLKTDALYRLMGSGALMLCQVGAGRADACYEAYLSAWDALAALLIVREAGGRTFPGAGDERGWRSGTVLAANPHLFEPLARIAGVSVAP
jgi:myo-inositol-1(or 4)-monophosphatase